MGFTFVATTSGLSVTDTGDFLQLRNTTAVTCKIKEIRVWQTSDTTLAMNGIQISRGDSGAAGSDVTNHEWDIGGPAAVADAFSLATTDVTTLDLDIRCGWNILQEFVWLPTPEFQIHLAESDHLGVHLVGTDSLTMGWTIIWEEFGS